MPSHGVLALRGLIAALRVEWKILALGALIVIALDILVPPLVLSVVRKPVDFFTFNPWLKRLPEYLAAGQGSLAARLERIWSLALFWFSSDNPYGIEWGFAVTVKDLARFALMGSLVGAYFALHVYRRRRLPAAGWGPRAGASGGALGAVSSVFGLATGGCTVMGCGAPVIPVVGLAFAGLSSTTLKWMSELSSAATIAVIAGLGLGVLYLAWRTGVAITSGPAARSAAFDRSTSKARGTPAAGGGLSGP